MPEPKRLSADPPKHIVDLAIKESLQSPCVSKRGVATFRGDDLVSLGYNHKPKGFMCDASTECKYKCGKDAVHAEQAAILAAHRDQLVGSEMLHVKSAYGVLVPSDAPSCLQCSKLIIEAGISAMWLFHPKGWVRYSPKQFHYLSGAYIPEYSCKTSD